MRVAVACLLGLILMGCDEDSSDTYTLYRDPVVGTGRVHMATFDAKGTGDYNKGNCEIARKLFVGQPNVTVNYWCEKGRYRP